MAILGYPWWAWAALWAVSTAIAGFVGARRDRPIVGVLIGLLFGPLGAVAVFILPFGGNMTCPSCGRRTVYAPMPAGWSEGSGASYPHLRCRRCAAIIPG
jgi:hypothetical protein